MTETYWKKFERACAAALRGGQRYPANSGEKIDVEGLEWAGQCKIVAELSLEQLTRLVETTDAEAQTRGKRGVVFVRVKRGRGVAAPGLAVMRLDAWTSAE